MSAASAPRGAIVSGGSSGIGLAIAERLLGEGWRVAIFSQQPDRVAQAGASLSARHGAERVVASTVDLRDGEAVRAFASELVERWGSVEGLVCNAGFSPKRPGGRTPLAEIPLEEWDDVLRVNLTGAFLCCRAVLPAMARQGAGRVVFVGSVAGRTLPRIAGAAYVASKSAIVGLMRSVVSEYSGQGITANAVCPGRILTEMAGDKDAPANVAALTRIPIGRLGRPDDVARAVSFLLAAEADFINGAVIDVNGGEFVAP